jgi:hypothetical protein
MQGTKGRWVERNGPAGPAAICEIKSDFVPSFRSAARWPPRSGTPGCRRPVAQLMGRGRQNGRCAAEPGRGWATTRLAAGWASQGCFCNKAVEWRYWSLTGAESSACRRRTMCAGLAWKIGSNMVFPKNAADIKLTGPAHRLKCSGNPCSGII